MSIVCPNGVYEYCMRVPLRRAPDLLPESDLLPELPESDLLDGKSDGKSTKKSLKLPTRALELAFSKFLYLHSSSNLPVRD